MRLKQFAIVSLFVGGVAMGCSGAEGELSESTLAVDGDDDSDSDSDSDECESDSDLKEIFRDASRRYRNTNNLAPDGFVQLQPECFTEEFTEGGGGTINLGIVFLNPAIIDGVIDPDEPEILYYEPQSDGSLVLMGGEYFCPLDACPTPPSFCGHEFRLEEDTGGHALHVWAWLSNPNGLTFPVNPNVDTTFCP